MKALVGFEVGTGNSIYLEEGHTVVTGVTQKSGKTTFLEGVISRSGRRAVVFKTKRGESGFNGYPTVQPYFREQKSAAIIDWQYVSSLLEATMGEKMLFPRSWIIKMCNGQPPRRRDDVNIPPAHTLEEVYNNIATAQANPSTRGIDDGVYTNLRAYFDIIIPEMHKHTFATKLTLEKGLNVMDLTSMRFEMQSLVIASVIDYVNDKLNDVIVVIPEAWEFVPQGRGSPVKLAAQRLAKKGAANGDFIFLDSQTVTSVDKEVLKQCVNWIMGLQTEINEVKRTLDQVGGSIKLKPEAIMSLPLGHFWAKLDRRLYHIYALPAWLPEDIGRAVARGELTPEDAAKYRNKEKDELTSQERAELARLRDEVPTLRGEVERWLKAAAQEATATDEQNVALITEKNHLKAELDEANGKYEDLHGKYNTLMSLYEGVREDLEEAKAGAAIVEAIKAILPRVGASEQQPCGIDLKVERPLPSLEVTVIRKTVKAGDDVLGHIVALYVDGVLPSGAPLWLKAVKDRFDERGWPYNNKDASAAMQVLVEAGLVEITPAGNNKQYRFTLSPIDARARGILTVKEEKA